VDFHVQNLAIPAGIPFYSGNLFQDLIIPSGITFLTVQVYASVRRKFAFIFIAVMCATLSYFLLLAGTFLLPNCSYVQKNKKSSGQLWFLEQ
jgi:ATP/ADP translocase